MISSKLRRNGLSQSLVQMGLGTISLVLLCAFGVSVQQPPTPQEALPNVQQEAVAAPNVTPPLNVPTIPPDDLKNDPLFLEIQKIVRAGSTPTGAKVPSSIPTDSMSNARWHAVESILAAARMLEDDVAELVKRDDVEGAAKTRKTIQSLRAQALDLLHL